MRQAIRFFPVVLLFTSFSFPGLYAGDASHDFAVLVEDKWQYDMRENPLYATSTGDHRYNELLPKISLEDCVRRNQAARAFLERLNDIPRDELTDAERNRYDIFGRLLRDDLAESPEADDQGRTPATKLAGECNAMLETVE